MEEYFAYFPLPPRVRERVNRLRREHRSAELSVPHLTVFGLRSESSIEDLVGSLRGVSADLRLRTVGLDHFGPYTAALVEGSGVHEVHMDVLDRLLGFMDAPLEDSPEHPAFRDVWERYGSVNFGERYNPHITLTKGASGVQCPAISFRPDRLCVARSAQKQFVDVREVYLG